ncbi:CGNR zinc finger domain-containing protein [Agromyces subbeticus]|uniref:CGNR zinc finger domain-containing protein n=1 Tax=Agromyces subbeticus TaxID=293890 RepID=UPI0003B4B60B|nr:CGNR zinc finger domain-containing protein [Agromyces subbeticus]
MLSVVATTPLQEYSQISGDPALDLVNTVSWRLNPERRIEHLADYASVLRWATQHGLVDEPLRRELECIAADDVAGARLELERVIELREAIYEAAYRGAQTTPIVSQHADAVAAGRLERATDAGWQWAFPTALSLPRRRIALAAVDLLLRGDLDRLGQCADAECGWVYLDTSPRHNRRWCVASDCGNRNRVREYYARSREAEAEDGAAGV